MAKLPKWAIKKYGISKAAWKAARSSSRRVKPMKRKKKGSRSGNNSQSALVKTVIMTATAAGWGATQDKVHSMLPAVPKIENYSDELIIGGLAAVATFLPMGKAGKYVKPATKTIMLLEVASAAKKAANKVPLSGN